MKMSEVLSLSSNELALVLEGLVEESERLRGRVSIADSKREYNKRFRIEKKIAKITREFIVRGWSVNIEGNHVKYEYVVIYNHKFQTTLI